MFIIIVGGGKVGQYLAATLSQKKHSIVLVDSNEAKAQRIAEELDNVLVVTGDGCDPLTLENAQVEKADVLVAVTGDDEDNLIISQLAKECFKVNRTFARVNNPRNQNTFDVLGIDAISATTIISTMIEEETSVGDLTTLLSLKRGNLSIFELKLTSDSPVTGKKVMDLKLPADCILATIIREDRSIFPRGGTVLYAGDSIIVLSRPENQKEIKKLFIV
ncbi:MAG: NAD-binding protein [Candidatus Saganbacteria bacterium]|nr:NAD-binding protein [Candidatus Saganbacteria bacterium]